MGQFLGTVLLIFCHASTLLFFLGSPRCLPFFLNTGRTLDMLHQVVSSYPPARFRASATSIAPSSLEKWGATVLQSVLKGEKVP